MEQRLEGESFDGIGVVELWRDKQADLLRLVKVVDHPERQGS